MFLKEIINFYHKHAKVFDTILLYCFSVAVTVISLAVTILLSPNWNKTTPFLVFLPAIMMSAWVGGLIPGCVTAVVAALEIDYLFIAPQNSLMIGHMESLIQLLLFVLNGFLMSVFIDIGKRYNRVIDYRKREKDYEKQITQMEQHIADVQKEVKSRDEFLSLVSHELKTPLTSMLLQIQTALHNIRNVSLANFSVDRLLKMLESTENQTKRLSRMITDMLNISLITTGRLELEREKVNLTDIVREVLQDFSERLRREGNEIKFEAEENIKGNWDKVRIEQAVTNLISNAIKYGNRKPIEISISHHENMALLTVKDYGIGIHEDEQKRIFGLFERAVPNHEYRGLGIGLYITYQIIKAHNGNLRVKSKEGKGSTFLVELPLHE